MEQAIRASLWEYVRASFWHSFALWEVGERVSVLLGFLAAAVLAALPFWGISLAFEPTVYEQAAAALGLWFILLVLLVTPYRLWREQSATIARLEGEKLSSAELGRVLIKGIH